MNVKQQRFELLVVAIPVLVLGFFIGIYTGEARMSKQSSDADQHPVSDDKFLSFWKAWNLLDGKFINAASTTDDQKIYGAIQGLTASYGDPYTVFFPPQQAKMFNDTIAGDFGGIGMEIGVKKGQLVVVAPLKGSPAEAAGVRAGEYILKINGTSTAEMGVDEAVQLIRGPKGTKVTITFLAPTGSKPVDLTITRDTINIPTIETSQKPGGVYVIRLYSFTAQSAGLFQSALKSFVASGDHKLVLDLRGNPGGYLEAAWDMASWFLPAGDDVVTEDFGKNGQPQVYRSKGYNIFKDSNLQMLILVDGGSASAAEILSGALSEHGIAKLVGSKTFGKGSVQELVSITPDTSLKVTVAHWLTPNGHNLSHDGLDPDYPVKTPDDSSADASSSPSDGSSSNPASAKDPVMDKALEILKNRP